MTALRSRGHHQKKYIPGGHEGTLVAGCVAEATAEAGCYDELGAVGDEVFAYIAEAQVGMTHCISGDYFLGSFGGYE
jgi:hypothetical protein